MGDVYITRTNGVWSKVWSDDSSIRYYLTDKMSFTIPNSRFDPRIKAGIWDGVIRPYSPYDGKLHTGLLPRVRKMLMDQGHRIFYENKPSYPKVTEEEIREWIEFELCPTTTEGEPLEIRPYQYKAIAAAINHRRLILKSATSSGKSFMIYATIRWLLEHDQIQSGILIVVPTVALVEQMTTDFGDYSQNDPEFDTEDFVHKIYSGKEKESDKPIVISTWQSIQDLPTTWFHTFDTLFGDEAHGFEAKKLKRIMESLINAHTRIGTTGTVKKKNSVHQITLEGLFGPIVPIIDSKEMMEKGYATKTTVKVIVFEYDEDEKKDMAKSIRRTKENAEGKTVEDKTGKYGREISWISLHRKRNHFIKNLVCKHMVGNTLILFDRLEEQGRPLYDIIKEEVGDSRPLYFVEGKTKIKDRETFRMALEDHENAIIMATGSIFRTGTNIKRLNNLLPVTSGKSYVNIMQAFGRLMRKSKHKDAANFYDLADDLTTKGYKNYSFSHLLDRLTLYTEEGIEYTIKKIKL